MGLTRPHIDRLENETLHLRFDGSADWSDLLSGVEELSARNLSGAPVNFLLEFAADASFSEAGRNENIAEFFVEFIPSPSAVAIVRPANQADTPGALAFRTRLAEAGFLTCAFDNRDAAELWLSLHPATCSTGLSGCGSGCASALTADCPPLANRHSA